MCVALLISTGAFAQVPPDPNNPNETLPDAMTQPSYGEPINTETAKKVAAAAIAEAKKRNWNGLCVAVVGPSGDLVYFEKQDNCQFASISIAQHKARTAARYRRPTVVFERLLGKGAFYAYLPTLDDVIASRGGNPLVVGGGRHRPRHSRYAHDHPQRLHRRARHHRPGHRHRPPCRCAADLIGQGMAEEEAEEQAKV